jgi:hypothetical protein
MLQGVGAQLVLSFHWPVASHDCTVLFEQRSAMPGAHSPPQSCFVVSQTNVHAVDAPHVPFAPHVSTRVVLPAAHRVVPGLQSPMHTPSPTHAAMHGGCAWFVPVVSQRKGVLLAPHVRVPGLHMPPQAEVSPIPVHAKGHVVVSCQMPAVSHCWMVVPEGLHRLDPAMQRLTHLPVSSSHTGMSAGHGG